MSVWASHLDPADGVMIDISPGAIGNAALPADDEYDKFYDFANGGDWGTGYTVNPTTGLPYEQQIVPRGDYGRILAEFWADGPHSETPPGHWFVILNYVNDHSLFEKRLGGDGPVIDDLQWDVKSYFAMGSTMHDVAVASWGVKGWYDYIRPVSALRYLCDLGQCTQQGGPSYHVDGVNLRPGFIELVTETTIETGERHEHLAGPGNENLGKIALYTWRGPDYISDPETDIAGVGWILAENWWPYQRPTFVTPPFAGYVSGHSTYSRAAALVMEMLTGDDYFPDGLGEFQCPQEQFLVFEDGPSVDVTLQWARYMDASDQCSLSRIWGGIHPPADDIPGRRMGNEIGPDAWKLSRLYYAGHAVCPGDLDDGGGVNFGDLLTLLGQWGPCTPGCFADLNLDGTVNMIDLFAQLSNWGSCTP
ncbi:MAG: vanadium-dependent haloperoxidase [Planctomycetes bacterium]|nr:vanadium-dependent haloperoxidase [Planctomycetota bacterium]